MKKYIAAITLLVFFNFTAKARDYVDLTATGTHPMPLDVDVIITNATCFGLNNGDFAIFPLGGTPPYTYILDGIITATGATLPNRYGLLAAGSYNFEIQDAIGGSVNIDVTITEPDALGVTISMIEISCNGASTGEIIGAASGGTPPYQYSIDGTNFGSSTFSSLLAGNYTISVKDANNCTHSEQVTISEPPVLVSSTQVINISCNGLTDGAISASPSGGTAPYEYSIDGTSFQSSNTFSGLVAGVYSLTIRDNNECTISENAEIVQPDLLTVSATFDGLGINVDAMGGTGPYSYSTDGIDFQSSSDFLLANGQYTFVVKDSNSCESTITQSLVITALEGRLENLSVIAYPNPVTSTLRLDGLPAGSRVRMFDAAGKLVMDRLLNEANAIISVATLKTGVYILESINQEGIAVKFRVLKE